MIAVNLLLGAPLDYWREYWQKAGGGEVIYAQDPRREAIRPLDIRTAGATVVINRKGQIVWRDLQATTYETLKEAVEQAL